MTTEHTSQNAVTFRSDGGLRFENVHVRKLRRGEVSVEIKATGVCHSDLHILRGDWPADRPLVLGHEASGIVTAIGDDVTGLDAGDHVVLSWFAPCGQCVNCAAGRAWVCTGTRAVENTLPDDTTAYSTQDGEDIWPFLGLGRFTSSVVVPQSAAIKVDEGLPFEVGALLGCSVTTGVGAVVNTAKVPMGSAAVVVGCGGVGLSIVTGLRLIGASPIIAVDLSPEKLKQAHAFGADVLAEGGSVDLAAHLHDTVGGVDFAFEAIGRASTIESLPSLLRPGGTAVLVGMTGVGERVSIDPFDLDDRGKSILGCNYGSSVARVDIPRLAELYRAGRLPLEDLIGRTRPLKEAKMAFEDLEGGRGLRTLLMP
jgi:S-(hydroxymethyl)glutathione dehydrogenase/alcohol dehydrogenase